ncbi:hypothetical protein ACT453_38715 [Bacillus sp. D-CC]
MYGKPSWIVPVIDDGGLVRAHTVIYASFCASFPFEVGLNESPLPLSAFL